MSSIDFKLSTGRGRIDQFDGYFFTDGAGAVSNDIDTVNKVTVAKTGTGKYTVTFPYYLDKVYSYNAKLHATSADHASFAQVDSFVTNSGGKAVMTIGIYTTSSAANVTGCVTWECIVRR